MGTVMEWASATGKKLKKRVAFPHDDTREDSKTAPWRICGNLNFCRSNVLEALE